MSKNTVKFVKNESEEELNLNNKTECLKYNIRFEKIKDDTSGVWSGVKIKLSIITNLLVVLTYLILGFCFQLWHPGWVVFLVMPIMMVLLNFNGNFSNNIVSLSSILIVLGYLAFGFFTKIWHPTWLIFFLIPIISIAFSKKNR